MASVRKHKNYFRVDQANVNAWPFNIVGEKPSKTLAIIIHGFTSSAFEVHDLAHYLADKDIDVEAVLMAGHGGSLRYLRDSGAQEWHESVEKIVKKKLDEYDNVILVGYSLGSNVALHIAKKYKKIKGVVALGIPIYMRQEAGIRFFLPLARVFKKRYKKPWANKDDLAKIAATGRHRYIPIKSIVELYRFIDKITKKEIADIDVPILIIHARDDLVSNPKSSEYLFKHIKSQDKTLYVLNKDNHNLVHDTRRDFVFRRIYQFITRL